MLISPERNDTIELTSEQVRNEAIEVVETKFELEINGYRYTSNEIWDALLYASASGKTINDDKLCMRESGGSSFMQSSLHIPGAGIE